MPNGKLARARGAILRAAEFEEEPQERVLAGAEKLASRLPDYRKEGEEAPEALKSATGHDDLRWKAGELGSQYGDVKTMKIGGEDYLPQIPKRSARKRAGKR